MSVYRVVTAASSVSITTKTTMHPGHAKGEGMTGQIEVTLDDQGAPDLDAPYSATLSLPVDGIKSGNGLQDREMRRRLDTGRYPSITVKVGEATKGDGGTYRATARLTVKGQTREVTGDVTFRAQGNRIVIEGGQTIDMRDFGVDPPRLLVMKVDPEVDVQVRVTAERQDA